ncbi:GNAT family N-acetyltransferase [Sinomicrobium oceani]|nr:GNAT family N-acetyltransferase [Sinomicrobium oceani]
MDSIMLRKAVEEDLKFLLRFEQGIIEAERPFDPTLKEGNIHYYDLSAFIRDVDTEVVVAEHNGKLIGSGYARIRAAEKFLKHKKYAYLGFMYVSPEFRGQGINGKIIASLTRWIRTRGICEIRLHVYDGNVSAIKAYEQAGFRRHMTTMRMDLDETP